MNLKNKTDKELDKMLEDYYDGIRSTKSIIDDHKYSIRLIEKSKHEIYREIIRREKGAE